MDITIKARAFEIEALEYLDQRAPEMYKGKKHGLYWGVHEVARVTDQVDWKRISQIRLEKFFSGKQYEDKIPPITHLTVEEDEYEKIARSMEKQFELKRPIQKAYCIRNVLKYAVVHNYEEIDTCIHGDEDKLIEFKHLSTDEKLVTIYQEVLNIRRFLDKSAKPFIRGGIEMKNNVKVLCWNLNFGSYDTAVPAAFVGHYLEGHDVIILTEVRVNEKLIKIIQELGYTCIVSDDQGKYLNQIIICAKEKYKLSKVKGVLNYPNGERGPNFLHGLIKVGEKRVNIIGMRVEIGKDIPYTDRFDQVKLMKSYIDNIEGAIICGGDFNNSKIKGAAEADYADVKKLYELTDKNEPSDLRFYNFHMIKDLIGKQFVLQEPMGEDNSWGLREENGMIMYGKCGSRIKNDLLFFSNDIEGSCKYSWEHVREHKQEYLDMLIQNRGNGVERGYPDHARLICELAVKGEEIVGE